jgi:hypothetical protein
MHRFKAFMLVAAAFLLASPVSAQESQRPFSQCLAVAQSLPGVTYANLTPEDLDLKPDRAAAGTGEVEISFAGHSTYVITTPGGITIATDYNGWSGNVAVPDVVTMNKAHSSHFTLSPDERIGHVLRGWNFDGTPADHDVVVDDVYIRNVTTDIRNFGAMEPDGNSIFIFEVADLCIGHLGHLHHPLGRQALRPDRPSRHRHGPGGWRPDIEPHGHDRHCPASAILDPPADASPRRTAVELHRDDGRQVCNRLRK